MRELTELAESFSMRKRRSVSRQEFITIISELNAALDKITSKFVDIDTSYKEIDGYEFDEFKNLIKIFHDDQFQNDLIVVYEVLNLYLLIKDRFGEAADWNLKMELRARLDEEMKRLLIAD